MHFDKAFTVSTPSDREIRVTRRFEATPDRVFAAFTEPALIRRWLLGPPGWTMPVCLLDLRVGGLYRYVWRSQADATEMGVQGAFREIVPHRKIVATERFDDAWYPGDALVTTEFAESDGATSTTITILYESTQARETARRSGMEHGMAAGYDRLDALFATPPGD